MRTQTSPPWIHAVRPSEVTRLHFSEPGHPVHQILERALVREYFDVDTVTLDLALLLQSSEVAVDNFGETILPRHENSLSAGELELGSAKCLLGECHFLWCCADGEEH